MRIAAVASVDMIVDTNRASAEFTMRSNKLQAVVLLTLALGAIAALVAPVLIIAIDAVRNPQVIHTLVEHPGSTVLLVLGVVVGLALLSFPLRAGFARLGGDAMVKMADGMVTFEGRGLLNRGSWKAPLAQFCGVTHHIRATLSGARHEIVLVHSDPGKDILLHVATRHPKDDAAYYADLLGLGQLQPRTLYTRRRSPISATIPVEIQARAA